MFNEANTVEGRSKEGPTSSGAMQMDKASILDNFKRHLSGSRRLFSNSSVFWKLVNSINDCGVILI